MDLKTQAIARRAVISHALRTAEKELSEASAFAREHGRADIALDLLAGLKKIRAAHRELEAVQAVVSDAVGGDIQARSGGSADDKNDPDPQP